MKRLTTLRGVCVGAGYFSRFQYDAWKRIEGVNIVACCNRSLDKAKAIATDFDIPRCYRIDQFGKMLSEQRPDFVDIITPPETHLSLCQQAVEAGTNIICQKPLAPTWEETQQLVRLVENSGVRFMVHENWRWQPWYREMRQLIDQGVLGDLFHCAVQCRLGDGWGEHAYLDRQPFFRDYPRLFIFETGVHFLDTFRYLLGEVDSVYTRIAKRNPVIKGEDSALIVCNMASGATAILDANRFNESAANNPRYTFGQLRLEGSHGHLELDLDGTITTKALGKPLAKHDYHPSTLGFAGDCVLAIQQHFVDCMQFGHPFESSAADYLKSVKLVEAAYESAHTGEVVSITDFTPAADPL